MFVNDSSSVLYAMVGLVGNILLSFCEDSIIGQCLSMIALVGVAFIERRLSLLILFIIFLVSPVICKHKWNFILCRTIRVMFVP
jgi:predicted MFS family arabinose efflux permease